MKNKNTLNMWLLLAEDGRLCIVKGMITSSDGIFFYSKNTAWKLFTQFSFVGFNKKWIGPFL